MDLTRSNAKYSTTAGDEVVVVHDGDRVAQIVFLLAMVPQIEFINSPSEFESTSRDDGGWGSSGK